MEENIKKDLIQLFKNTCSNFDISRSNKDIVIEADYDTRRDMYNTIFPKVIEVEGQKSMERHEENIGKYHTGFRFSDNPPLGISGISKTYKVKYGRFFPIITYLFINNYKRRKLYKTFCDNLVKSNQHKWSYWCCTLEKHFKLTSHTKYIIHGTLYAEITETEYDELDKLYKSKVNEYDLHKLKSRLEK